VQDDGGTTNNGVDLEATPKTLTINVTPVADAPTLLLVNGPNLSGASMELFRTSWETQLTRRRPSPRYNRAHSKAGKQWSIPQHLARIRHLEFG